MSGQARVRLVWAAAAFACAMVGGALPVPLAVPALAIATAVVPGAWLAPLLAAEAPIEEQAAFALLLSPFVHGALFALLRVTGVDGAFAARALALLWAALAAERAVRGHPAEGRAERPAWGVAAGVGLVLGIARLASSDLALRSDGSFHAGVVGAAARALPPEDPFFAGLALRYPWGPHAWAASWLDATPGLAAIVPLVVSSALAAVATLLAVRLLAHSLGAGPRTAVFAQVLALAGTAPFAWLTLVARAASGEVRGLAELQRSLGRGADQALRALDPGLLHPSLVLPLDKFVVVTPFAWGLAGIVLAALSLRTALATGSLRDAVRLACVIAAMGFAHPLAGLAGCGAVVAGTLAELAAPAAQRVPLRTVVTCGIAAVAGVVAIAPYLWQVSAGGLAVATHASPSFAPRGLVSAAYAGAFVLVPAWRVLRGPSGAPLRGMLLVLTLPACALGLPGDNQTKFLNLAFVLAAAPAACAWAAGSPSPARRAWLRALFVVSQAPTLAAVLWAYARQSPASIDSPSRPPAAIVDAVRTLTEPDAVLEDMTLDGSRGAAPALPGETGRSLLWGGAFLANKWGLGVEALRLREDASARGLPPAAAAGLRARPLWLVMPLDTTRPADPHWRVAARAGGVVLARWE